MKGVKPRYAEKSLSDKPTGQLHLMVSKAGRDGSIGIRQDADLWLAKLERDKAFRIRSRKIATRGCTSRKAKLL